MKPFNSHLGPVLLVTCFAFLVATQSSHGQTTLRVDHAIEWTRQWGTSSSDVGSGIATDDLGNIFVTGYTQENLDGSSVLGNDIFLTKYDTDGILQWSRQLNMTDDDRGQAVSTDASNNVYITGYTRLGAIVSKFDAAGTQVWTQQFGTSSNDRGFGISADAMGSVYVSGSTANDLGSPYAGGGSDAFLRK